jgi:cytochrome c biogenesis protein CcdA
MPTWIEQLFQGSAPNIVALPAAVLLGVLGAVSSCCNLAVIGAVAGYSGSLAEERNRRSVLIAGFFFLLGTVLALAAVGAAIGFAGRAAGAALGGYWRFGAGLIMVFFGLAGMNLIPFALPKIRTRVASGRHGMAGAVVFGLAVGGGATACTVACNPVLPMALGFAMLQGGAAWGAAILGAFALGYSLVLAAGVVGLGLGFGKLQATARKVEPYVRYGAGGLLVLVGFYLLATI